MEKHGAILPHPKNIFEIFWEYLDLFWVHYKKIFSKFCLKHLAFKLKQLTNFFLNG